MKIFIDEASLAIFKKSIIIFCLMLLVCFIFINDKIQVICGLFVGFLVNSSRLVVNERIFNSILAGKKKRGHFIISFVFMNIIMIGAFIIMMKLGLTALLCAGAASLITVLVLMLDALIGLFLGKA